MGLLGWGMVLGVVCVIGWVWLTYFRTSKTGQTTAGKYITAAIDGTQLIINLGYVELLRKVDAIEANPEATAACAVISDTLWAAAKQAWADAQVSNVPPTPAPVPTPAIADLQAQLKALAEKVNSQTTTTPPAATVAVNVSGGTV